METAGSEVLTGPGSEVVTGPTEDLRLDSGLVWSQQVRQETVGVI